jgi:hypothetical protein
MPAVNLTNGDTAILYSRNEISERVNRAINKSFMVAGTIASKLQEMGFDEDKPETWSKWSELNDDDQEKINDYQAELIIGMVKSWSRGELPTKENVLDLPTKLFQELANFCGEEFNKVEEFSPDGVTDPKVPTEG